MKIRNATKDDLDIIISMGEQLQNESKVYEPLLIFNRVESYNHYAKELENDEARIIVAVDSDEIITGYQYSYVSTLDYLSGSNRECTLEALYVNPEYRGRGIAKMLVEDAERWASSEKKVDRIKAGIYVGNEASERVHLIGGFTPYYTEYIKVISSSE